MFLFFDTETTGLPPSFDIHFSESELMPRLVQLGYLICDESGKILKAVNKIIKPDGFKIPLEASQIHGIDTHKALAEGESLFMVLNEFVNDVKSVKCLVAHNFDFDNLIICGELFRCEIDTGIMSTPHRICTMKSSTDYCAIENYYGYKWPTLTELYWKLFETQFDGAHDAFNDVTATKESFFELLKREVISLAHV